MKKLFSLIICVVMAFLTLSVTACDTPTKAYTDFYNTVSSKEYEVPAPSGYENFSFEIYKFNDYFDFEIYASNKGSLYVSVNKNKSKGISTFFRENTAGEMLATIKYSQSTATGEVIDVAFKSEKIDSTNAIYNEIVQKSQEYYATMLPVINDFIAQISNGKYSSIDDLYKS